LPAISRSVEEFATTLLSTGAQRRLDERLADFPAWTEWVEGERPALGLEPFTIGPGLPMTPAVLVALARAFFPGFELSPYDIGPAAVTEVCAQADASAFSHSQNDLPAPPHTAGFFDPSPPQIAIFGCIRAHPGGGGETTVTDLARVLEALSEGQRSELRNRELIYRTANRLGRTTHGFRALSAVHDLPFLRFRMDYTESRTDLLAHLEQLILASENQYSVALEPGEVICVWNGSPHGRRPQKGATPARRNLRRKLIRCRLRMACARAD
jgi:hypothetical protein